ncbi:MAG TPA: metallophosphoesterase [Bacteroidia bacterium]|jgi:hypothetical protein
MKLEIGYKHGFEIRKEYCIANCKESFSILYLSDFHFNRFSASTIQKIIKAIRELNPDIILLGGDYSDSTKGLSHLKTLMGGIAERKNIFAIAGNHDYSLGIDKIKKIITDNNANWIEQKSVQFELRGNKIRVDGNISASDDDGNADFSILCLHKPINIAHCKNHYKLAFAGHLHGSQFVFWQTAKGLYPGKLFYKWNILESSANACRYFISKGLGDTLPIRYNCKKDIIFVTVASAIHPIN